MCDYKCHRAKNLKYHQKKAKKSKTSCQICEKVFCTHASMTFHKNSEHGKISKFDSSPAVVKSETHPIVQNENDLKSSKTRMIVVLHRTHKKFVKRPTKKYVVKNSHSAESDKTVQSVDRNLEKNVLLKNRLKI